VSEDSFDTRSGIGTRSVQTVNRTIHIKEVEWGRMSDRTDRLLAVLVILLALLVVSQTTVVPRNQLLDSIGLVSGVLAIVFALAELVTAF